jgi:hypothetical protein
MSADILTPLIRRIWHPHHLEQSKIHTTWLIESQRTWVANPAKFALSDGESTLRYSRGTCGAAFPPNSPLGSRDFLCFTGQIVFLRWNLGICCVLPACLVPKAEERHFSIPKAEFPAISAAMLCAPLAAFLAFGPTPL